LLRRAEITDAEVEHGRWDQETIGEILECCFEQECEQGADGTLVAVYRVDAGLHQQLARNFVYVELIDPTDDGPSLGPMFEQMCKNADSGKFDRILFSTVFDLGRSGIELVETFCRLTHSGAAVWPVGSHTGPVAFDPIGYSHRGAIEAWMEEFADEMGGAAEMAWIEDEASSGGN
jgi:hypothetical protein